MGWAAATTCANLTSFDMPLPWRIRLKANHGGKGMFHLIWYVLIGLVSGVIAKSVMHEHMTIFWTIVLGIVGSLIGGGVTHMLAGSKNSQYHPAGLIFSTLGAILVLFICYKLKIHLPQVMGLSLWLPQMTRGMFTVL
jgi:uncharacterized membrane protein YeaQ/YmgE (transglycosylase-associated protein family)